MKLLNRSVDILLENTNSPALTGAILSFFLILPVCLFAILVGGDLLNWTANLLCTSLGTGLGIKLGQLFTD